MILLLVGMVMAIIAWALIDYKIKSRKHRNIYRQYMKNKQHFERQRKERNIS